MSSRVVLKDVQEAGKRISSFIHRTPVMTCSTLDKMAARTLYFKCEIFQKVGAFKFRGASNAVGKLIESYDGEVPRDQITVVTHSSGNHGQAIALAAKLQGVQAHVVMPTAAPGVKKAAVRGYGAKVTECENTKEAREGTCDKIVNSLGQSGFIIHPFNDVNVIAGQGTIALEFLEQVENLDAIVCPVGGGGLISGVCIAVKSLKPNIKIYAAEPLNADDCAKSFAAGERIPLQGPPNTIADGLRTSIGETTWPIIRDNIDDVITVTEDEIIAATKLILERMKVVVEPSTGVVLAAVLSEKFKKLSPELKNIGLLLCGGNLDLDKPPWINNKEY